MIDTRKPAAPAIPPTFETRDSNSPDFWNERFDQRFTPWDQAGVPEAFQTFALAHRDTLQNVLIPGCGSAYEARWLARENWPVKAIDFSPSAVAAARDRCQWTYRHACTSVDIGSRNLPCVLSPVRVQSLQTPVRLVGDRL